MKKPWILGLVGLIAIILAIGAVACNDDEEDNGNGGETPPQATATVEATPVSTSADQTPSATSSGTPQAAAPVDVTLNEVGGSGVTGTATLSEGATAGTTAVEVVVDGGLTEGEHQNHIHTGTCEAQGDVVQALTPLQAGADGSATGTTPAVPAELSTFEGGSNYVAVHATDGTVVACGNIPVM